MKIKLKRNQKLRLSILIVAVGVISMILTIQNNPEIYHQAIIEKNGNIAHRFSHTLIHIFTFLYQTKIMLAAIGILAILKNKKAQ